MRRHQFELERGGRKIEVLWGRRQDGATVLLDGEVIGSLQPSSLEAGASVRLPDGTTLLVERVPRRWWAIGMRDELRLERGGQPVPGSDADPRTVGRRAARLVVWLGIFLAIFAGLWGAFSQDRTWILGAFEGIVLLVLGVLARMGVRLSVALAALVLVAEPVILLVGLGRTGTPTTLVLRTLVVAYLLESCRRMGVKSRARPSGGAASTA
jgi:hypothetical protein